MKQKICKGCREVFTDFLEKDYCTHCEKERLAVKNNKCLACGGLNPSLDNWGCCEKCSSC